MKPDATGREVTYTRSVIRTHISSATYQQHGSQHRELSRVRRATRPRRRPSQRGAAREGINRATGIPRGAARRDEKCINSTCIRAGRGRARPTRRASTDPRLVSRGPRPKGRACVDAGLSDRVQRKQARPGG